MDPLIYSVPIVLLARLYTVFAKVRMCLSIFTLYRHVLEHLAMLYGFKGNFNIIVYLIPTVLILVVIVQEKLVSLFPTCAL